MLRNYLLIAFRNILKKRIYSFINIAGLSVGFAATILIFLFLQDELSYDRFHDKSENLFRVAWFGGDPQTRTPHPMAEAMAKDFAEVESAVSLTPLWGPGLTRQVFTLKRPEEDSWHEEREILGVDSTFLDVFSFKLLSGNPKTVLRQVGGILVSESAALKYFGNEDPIGQLLMVNDENTIVQVEGVFEDVPPNSHFHFHSLVSYVTLKAMNPGDDYYTWNDFGHFNYIRLVEGVDYEQLESKLMPWLAGYLDWDEQTLERLKITNEQMKLQPVVDIHLRSNIRWELSQNGHIGYVYIMSAAGIFILIIASFNFMNLTTARSMERAGEIGVRKAMGANKSSLYLQFLGESILMAGMAIILAGLIVEVALPSFNTFTGKDLQLNVSNPSTLILLLSSAAIVGLLSGLYPAAFLSSLKPVLILKGKQARSGDGKLIRKSLVTMQFAISMFLISGVAIIYQQMNYLNTKSLGFDKEAIVVIPIKTDETRERFETLQTEVNSIDGVLSISAASNIPGKQFNQNPIWKDSDPQNPVDIKQFMVDYEIFETLGLELIDGRTFSRENPSDTTNFIVNESAMRSLNLGDTLGSPVKFDMDSRMIEGTVIGVIKDFHYQSLHQPVRPLVFQLIPAYNFALVRIKMDDFNNTISNVASTWNGFDGNFDFEYDFLDETLAQQYAKEEKMGIVFGSFAVLAIIIACLGLGAMASIDFSSRKKEIGIKKVLGAPSANLIINLLKEYTLVVVIALILAAPAWWIIMSNWLNNFNFRITLNPLLFLASGLLLILISWSTLGYQTFTTIRANPVESLKEE